MKKIFSLLISIAVLLVFTAIGHTGTISAYAQDYVLLPAGQTLSVAAPSGTTGSVTRLARTPGGGAAQSVTAVSSADLIFGPYVLPQRFKIICTAGTITTTVAPYNPLPKIASIVMAQVDYTLSAAEALCSVLVVTSSPSGKAIIAPAVEESGVSRLYTVRNAGGDSADVILKISGGTGVTVGTGKTAEVFYSGTDYVRKTADATH